MAMETGEKVLLGLGVLVGGGGLIYLGNAYLEDRKEARALEARSPQQGRNAALEQVVQPALPAKKNGGNVLDAVWREIGGAPGIISLVQTVKK